VPISRLAECIDLTKADHAGAPFPVTLVGHAGDGNFHLVYVIDPGSPLELAQAQRLADRLVARALEMGGTSTGEHGIGFGKMKYMEAEHGDALQLMRALKRMFDPEDRMNPGKLVEC
jgi:D-lactate dehydrogenase (cytochrome)